MGAAAFLAAAASLSVVMLFHSERATTKKIAAGSGDGALNVALSDHLERSQILLTELEHRKAAEEQTHDEQLQAQRLLENNRRLRDASLQRGEVRRAALLDDLEPALVTIANAPAQMSQAKLALLQEQLQEDGSLFKVRVARTHLARDSAANEKDTARRRDVERIRGPL